MSPAILPRPDVETERSVARAFLRRLPPGYHVAQAILFGSRARGDHRPDSDLDLAVVLEGQRGDFIDTKGLRGNKRFEWIALPPRVMAGPGPATHDLAQYNTASRGWCAFAHHDTKGPMLRPNRFVYSHTGPKLDMAGIAFDVLMETGVLVQALPLWGDDLVHPERFINPALIHAIATDGVCLG
jgi:hypothetical protein